MFELVSSLREGATERVAEQTGTLERGNSAREDANYTQQWWQEEGAYS